MTKDFGKAISSVSKKTRALKNSLHPFGVLALAQVVSFLPGMIGQLIMMWLVSKATLIMSNVPGPKYGLKYKGATCNAFIALVPGLGDLALGITAMSMGENIMMAI